MNANYSHLATFEYSLFVNHSQIICISGVILHTNYSLLSATTMTFNAACPSAGMSAFLSFSVTGPQQVVSQPLQLQ
jgi:hypothetical protein